MQTRKLFFLTLIFFSQLSLGQTYSSLTTDNEIYDFLNWLTSTEKKYDEAPYLKRKQIYYKILHWNIDNFVWKDTANIRFLEFDLQYLFKKKNGVDTIFNKADQIFMLQQFTAIIDTTWQKPFHKSKIVFKKKQPKPNRYSFSIPLFSVDKKYVVIRKSYFCGDECGYSGYYVYRKKLKNKWEYLTCINCGMS